MIEFFLKDTFPRYHGINPDNVVVPIVRKSAPFTEVDMKACNDAAATDYNKDSVFNKFTEVCSTCDKVVLSVDNNGQEIAVVNFEEYIDKLPKRITTNNRCDLLMTDGIPHNKIVFCDLCCYDEKYIGPNNSQSMPEGKRAKARKQMEESVELFMNIHVLNHHILTYPEKVYLFASKSYHTEIPVSARRRDVESNMQAMTTTASSMSGQIITEKTVMSHNFTFVQNRYPSVYKW